MDLILGDQQVRIALEEGVDIIELERTWVEELKGFEELCRSVFLYDEM